MFLALCVGMGLFGCSPSPYSGFGGRYRHGGVFNGCNPVLCQDNENIVCALPDRDKGGCIYRIAKSGTIERTIESPTYLGFPDVSPDGKMIAYVNESTGVPAIWIADITGKNPRRLTTSRFPEMRPRFSSDGNSIAFARYMELSAPSRHTLELFIIGIDGQSELRLTNDNLTDLPVRFSQDGAHLYFTSERSWSAPTVRSDTAHLFKISLDTFAITPVLQLDLGAAGSCDLSMDEKTVAYIIAPQGDYAYDVFTCGIDGSNKQQRTTLRSFIGSVRFGFHNTHFTLDESRRGYGARSVYLYDLTSSSMTTISLPKH